MFIRYRELRAKGKTPTHVNVTPTASSTYCNEDLENVAVRFLRPDLRNFLEIPQIMIVGSGPIMASSNFISPLLIILNIDLHIIARTGHSLVH
jgi:hypothetical protein